MATFLKRLVLLALLGALVWKINQLMNVKREARTPELPQA